MARMSPLDKPDKTKPQVPTLLICRNILWDKSTREVSLYGLVQELRFKAPSYLPPLWFVAEVAARVGTYNVEFQLTEGDDDRVLWSESRRTPVTNELFRTYATLQPDLLAISETGWMRLRCRIDGVERIDRLLLLTVDAHS